MLAGLRGKGVSGEIRRVALLPVRYGWRPDRIVSRLVGMISLLDRWDSQPTIPVTGEIIKRHPFLAQRLAGADVAIHGYRHIAYRSFSPEEQSADLDAAERVLWQNGLSPRGFRSPYLDPHEGTLALLRRRNFAYDSSYSEFSLPRTYPAVEDIRQVCVVRYGDGEHARSEAPPPVELPVSLPDDEVLVDALGIRNPAALWRIYESMLEHTANVGSHLVMQVHPERFHICKPALELLLDKAEDLGAWVTSLSDAADWILRNANGPGRWPHGRPFAVSVTGDLDAATIGDFALRTWGG